MPAQRKKGRLFRTLFYLVHPTTIRSADLALPAIIVVVPPGILARVQHPECEMAWCPQAQPRRKEVVGLMIAC